MADRKSDGKLAPGNGVGKQSRWQKGQSGNPGGRPPKSSILKFVETIGLESVSVQVPGESKARMVTNGEFVARRFWHHLKTCNPIDIQAMKLAMEYLDGKPKEIDASAQRSPEESAVLIFNALRSMDESDGLKEPLDTGDSSEGTDPEMVAPAKASRRPSVSKKRKAVQRPPSRKKVVQDRNRKKKSDPKGPK